MAGGKRRLNAMGGQHAPRGYADGENSGLGVLGEAEVDFRPFKDQP